MTVTFTFNPVPAIDDAVLGKEAIKAASKHTPINENAMPVALVSLGTKLKRYYAEELERAQQALHELQTRADAAEHATTPAHVENKLRTGASSFYGFDFSGRERRLRQSDEIFRQRNKALGTYMRVRGLTSLPTRADTLINPRALIITLIAVTALEAVLNAAMFLGPLNGLQALAITVGQAVTNVGLSYIVGWLLIPRMAHALELSTRVWSAVLFGMHVLFTLYLNYSVSFYRDLLVTTQSNRSRITAEAKSSILDQAAEVWFNPNFWDVMVIVYGTAGLMFAIFAYIKGYFSDDPNPGFGPTYRAIKKSNEGIEEELGETVLAWDTAKLTYRRELANCISTAKGEISEWSESINLVEKIKTDWINIIGGMNQLYQRKIDLYVDSYNEVSPDKAISPQVVLLNDWEVDVNTVFSDVSHYFLSDAERLGKVAEMQPGLDDLYETVGVEFGHLSETGDERISRLSASFPSSTIGGD